MFFDIFEYVYLRGNYGNKSGVFAWAKGWKNDRQMDYLLFASIIKKKIWQKSYIMSSINNHNRFNIKLIFGPGTTLKGSPEGWNIGIQ